jgi:hypothetical protein
MFRRTSTALAVALGLVIATTVAGCGGSTSVGQQGTSSSGTSLAAQAGVDLGSPATPIAVGTVLVTGSVKAVALPSSLPLYEKRVEHPLSKTAMEDLAGLLDLGKISMASDVFASATYSVEFPGDGDATCFNLKEKKAGERYRLLIEQGKGEEVPALPSDDEATNMADEYLRRLGLDTGLERMSVSIQDQKSTVGKDSTEVTYDLSKRIDYQARVGGLPLLGPGADVCLTFGPGGELLHIAHLVMPVTKGPDVKLRQLDLALSDLMAGKGLPPATMTAEAAKEISVKDVSLAYWAEPFAIEDEYYKPVYVFTVVGKGGEPGSWIVPAY